MHNEQVTTREITVVPPPAITPRASKVFSPAVLTQIRTIESAFGGRSQVIATLACAPKSAALDFLLALLTDEDHHDQDLADLCTLANIRPAELLQQLSAGNVLYAQTLAYAHLPQHLPRTVEDLLKVSHDYEAVCDVCWGEKVVTHRDKDGAITETTPCKACKQTGQRTYQALPEARNKALEIGGLTEKRSGPIINVGISQSVGTSAETGRGSLAQAQAVMDAAFKEPLTDDE